MAIKVSIIVTCYNLERYIHECLTSLLDQDCRFEYEVWVIDDCSTDGSLAIIESIESPRLKIIRNRVNQGAAQSVDDALQMCSGEYLCRFDGDDKWPPHYLRTAAAVLDAHTEVDMVYGDMAFIDSSSAVTAPSGNVQRRDMHERVLENEFADILRSYYINAPTIMFRKEAFAKAFPLPQFLMEKRNFIDWYISLVVLHSGKAYFIPEPIAYYRLHATNNHRIIVLNKNAEEVTEFILRFFVPQSEKLTPLQRRQIMADNYHLLGEQYFGRGMYDDARRMYAKTAQTSPLYLLKPNFVKHWLGVLVGGKTYERTRRWLGSQQMAS